MGWKFRRRRTRTLEVSNLTKIATFWSTTVIRSFKNYSRHCRLVGQDEVCIHDGNVYFVLWHEKKQKYLKNIIANIEQWFSVVGLVENLQFWD